MSADPLERLNAVVRAERAALLAVARSEGLDAEEALECVQDALCAWLGESGKGSETSAPMIASLKTRTRNAARNFRRRHRRLKPHVPLSDTAGPDDGESLLAAAEQIVRLRSCVHELCGMQRSVVLLRLLDEQSGEDVARALGIERGHVDVLVHRAKQALRVCMRHDKDEV